MIDLDLHRGIEIGCGVTAWVSGLALVVRALRNTAHRWALALGASLFLAGVLDILHGVLSAMPEPTPYVTERIVPWSWMLGRFWIALGFYRSWLALRGVGYRFSPILLIGAELLVGCAALAGVFLLPLPPAYVYGWRPPELILHVVAYLPLLAIFRGNRILATCIALHLLTGVVMGFSAQSLDALFTAAHATKALAYLWLLIWIQLDSPLAQPPALRRVW